MTSLIEASKVAASFLSGIGQSLPLVLGCMVVSVFLTFTYPDGRVRYFAAAALVFFATYVTVWRWVDSRKRSHAMWELRHIAEDERLVLQRYLKENRAVCYFSVFHGPTASLIAKHILAHATTTFPYTDAPVVLQPFVMVHLRKHPELIGLKHEEIGATKMQDELDEREPAALPPLA